MAKAASKAKDSIWALQPATKQTLAIILSILTVVFTALSGLAYWGGSYATNMVKTELTAQNIYFPEANSPEFSASEYPDLQKYAGQRVDSSTKAKAYANGYIGRHLDSLAEGKSYAEVSKMQSANPDDPALAAQKEALFMGETLRGILLGTGYAFGLIGTIALIASASLASLAIACSVVAVYLGASYKRSK